MWKEIRGAMIGAIITVIVSFASTLILNCVSEPPAKINQGSFLIDKNNYINTIMVKNTKNDNYLDKFDIIIDPSVQVYNLKINDKDVSIKDNVVKVDTIKPNDTRLILITANSRLEKTNISFAQNGRKFAFDYFNDYSNISLYTLILIGTYAVINFVFVLITNIKLSKKSEIAKNEYETMRNESKQKLESATKETQDLFLKANNIEKKLNAVNKLYIKEMADMENEMKFYRELIIKICGHEITKTELDSIISSKLKTFKRKNIKHLSYADIYDIIIKSAEDN